MVEPQAICSSPVAINESELARAMPAPGPMEGEEIFTRPRLEVIKWLPAVPQEEQSPATEEPELSPSDVSCERFRTLAYTPALLRQLLPFLSPPPPVRPPGVMRSAKSRRAARPCRFSVLLRV